MLRPEQQAVAGNLLEALRFFGSANKTGEIQDLPGVSLIFCGFNYAAFNAALIARPVADSNELSQILTVAAQRFGARQLRWTCWACDDFLGPTVLRDAGRIFHRHGLRPLTEAPGMYTDTLAAPDRPLPAVEVRPVSDAATRTAFAEIMSTGFEIPRSVCDAIYGSDSAWEQALRGYVGFANGAAVTTAAVRLTGDTIGLYSVATLPRFRRRGYAESLMRAIVEAAMHSTGVKRTVLQSTRSGFALYQKMGYRTVTNFNVYIAD